jgi:hypothetical protein
MDGSLASSISEHLRASHEEGVEFAASESSRAKASSDMAIVKAAIAEVNDLQSQADILKALVTRASSFAPRVAFFVIKGEQASGWRARGFEGTVGDEAIQEISLPLSADTVVGGAAKSLVTWSGGPGSHSEDHLLLNRLGDETAQRIVAIPLVVRKRAVAVLYADSAGLDSESINLEALETLVRVSGMAVELLSVSRVAPKTAVADVPAAEEHVAEPAVQHDEEVATAYAPTSEYEEAADVSTSPPPPYFESSPTADTLKTETVEPEPAPEAVHETPTYEAEPPSAQIAGDVIDATPASEPAPSPVSTEEAAVSPRRRHGQEAELPIDVASEDERRLHNDARRFARLLISEIKLYNEQKVVEGRSQHDLYDRLREYIDRSREMYDKRVKSEVAARYDYFHGELVNTLAEGDATKLGSNYPGATVPA